MTIQEIGSLGEFVAAIATIATLVYLAIQIRQNTAVARSAATQEVLGSFRELIRELALSPELGRIHTRGMNDLSPQFLSRPDVRVRGWLGGRESA